jgi:exoribonuclease R
MIYNGEHDHSHEVMNLKSYIHITSPIRRLIDLLNQMLMFDKLGLVKQVSKDAREFLSSWMDQIEYINTSMRSIRKIQTDCELVHRCFTDPEIMKREHTGVIFDKILINNNMYSYMVYLEDIKLLSRITCRDDLSNYTKMMFKTYLFEDEDKIKKKIRLHIVTDV